MTSPIHHWPLNDGSGTTVLDVVGTNHGTIRNPSYTTWVAAEGTGALRMSGVYGDYTVSPNVRTSLKYPSLTSFGLRARFKTTNSSGAAIAGFTFTAAFTPDTLDKVIYMGADGRLRAAVNRGSASTVLWSPNPCNDGQWHDAFLQHFNTTAELWLDGVLVHSVTTNTPTERSGYWDIGGTNVATLRGSFNGSRAFDGDIRDVQVFDAWLSPAEIAALATPVYPPIPTPWYVPQGAKPGKGVCNVVNCKIQATWLSSILRMQYPYGYSDPYPYLALYPLEPVVRYTNATCITEPGRDLYGVFAWGATGSEVGNEGWGRPPNFVICDSVYYNEAEFLFGEDVFYAAEQTQDEFVISTRSKNPATHGTSQYPPGFAPVPAFNVINVSPGTGTLSAAVAAAKHGDNLVLAPGTYYLDDLTNGYLLIDKAIRIYGATEDPDDVLITWSVNHASDGLRAVAFHLYRMVNVPEPVRAPGLFHVTVRQAVPGNWGYYPTIKLVMEDYPEDFTPWITPPSNDITGNCPWMNEAQICLPSSNSRCRTGFSSTNVIVNTR